MSSGVVTNYSHQEIRRVEWIVGVDYGEDYEKVQKIVYDILAADHRILIDLIIRLKRCPMIMQR